MRAGDIMTEKVICVDQGASVFDAAEAMLGAGVSAVPVVDAQNRIVGMISEADLMRRGEIGTTARESWLSRLVGDNETAAHEFVQPIDGRTRRETPEAERGRDIASGQQAFLHRPTSMSRGEHYVLPSGAQRYKSSERLKIEK